MATKSVKGSSQQATTAVTSGTSKPVKAKATAESARQALEATAILLAFVFFMTMVAGIGPTAGKVSVLLMVSLIVLQGLGHVNPFVKWASDHPLTPGDNTFTVGS